MFLKTRYLSVLSSIFIIAQPAISLADTDVKPVPFNAERFLENIELKNAQKQQEKAVLNVEIISAQSDDSVARIEPAAGSKNPEPYYMLPSDYVLLSGEASLPSTLPSAVAPQQQAITPDAPAITAGQKLSVTVTGEADLTGVYPVKSDGSIDFPMIGKVNVSALNKDSAADLITAKLKDGYLVNPQVDVGVLTIDPIFVLGDVQNPGAPIYSQSLSISSAIETAGGYEHNNQTKSFQVLRANNPSQNGLQTVERDSEILNAGDVLIVKEIQ